jgi:hypothetical protein
MCISSNADFHRDSFFEFEFAAKLGQVLNERYSRTPTVGRRVRTEAC